MNRSGSGDKMKIDSNFLDISINPEYMTAEGKTVITQKTIEMWDDGDIVICLNETDDVIIRVEELEEIVRVYKMYRDRRKAYLLKKISE